jgi:four helix bundle protein
LGQRRRSRSSDKSISAERSAVAERSRRRLTAVGWLAGRAMVCAPKQCCGGAGQIAGFHLCRMGDYRKLQVYDRATEFADRVAAFVHQLPARLHDNADQLRRAADSVPRAIAEGCGLGSDPQLLRFLRVALGSANECENELHLLNRRGHLREVDLELIESARRLCAMLASFISRVDNDVIRQHRRLRRAGTEIRRPGPQRASREPSAEAESAQPRPSVQLPPSVQPP